jgi:hypothetical protein
VFKSAFRASSETPTPQIRALGTLPAKLTHGLNSTKSKPTSVSAVAPGHTVSFISANTPENTVRGNSLECWYPILKRGPQNIPPRAETHRTATTSARRSLGYGLKRLGRLPFSRLTNLGLYRVDPKKDHIVVRIASNALLDSSTRGGGARLPGATA